MCTRKQPYSIYLNFFCFILSPHDKRPDKYIAFVRILYNEGSLPIDIYSGNIMFYVIIIYTVKLDFVDFPPFATKVHTV